MFIQIWVYERLRFSFSDAVKNVNTGDNASQMDPLLDGDEKISRKDGEKAGAEGPQLSYTSPRRISSSSCPVVTIHTRLFLNHWLSPCTSAKRSRCDANLSKAPARCKHGRCLWPLNPRMWDHGCWFFSPVTIPGRGHLECFAHWMAFMVHHF